MKKMIQGLGIAGLVLVLCVGFSPTVLQAQTYTWQKLNGPYGNDIVNIFTIGKSDVIAGTYLQGTGFSKDMGQHWTMLPDSMPTFVSGFLTSKGTILAMSYDSLYRSTDNGSSWHGMELSNDNIFFFGGYAFAEDTDSSKVYAGTNIGLFVSDNDGQNWSPTSLTDAVMKIIITKTGRIIALTDGGYAMIPSLPSGPSAVKISDDGGLTWTTKDLPGNGGASDLEIDGQGNWYVSVRNQDVYESSDKGDSWTPLNFPNPNVTQMAIDPAGDLLVGCDSGLVRYDVNTQSFKPTNLPNVAVSAITIAQDGAILVGTADLFKSGKADGIFRSDDNGDTWSMVGASPIAPLSMTVDDNDGLFVGATLFGLYHSADGGSSWDRLFTGSKNFLAITALKAGPNGEMMLSSLTNQTIYYSMDHGNKWFPSVINAADTQLVVNKFMYLDDKNVWAAVSTMFSSGKGGVYASADSGKTWSLLGMDGKEVSCMAQTKDAVFAGTAFNGLFKTTNNGITWTNITGNLKNSSYIMISSLFEAKDGTLLAGTSSGIQRSTDDGATWSVVSDISITDYPQVTGDEIVSKTFAENSKGELFAGTGQYGLLYSKDDGQSWTGINSGFDSKDGGYYNSVVRLAVDKKDNLYAIGGTGVYKAQYHDTPIERVSETRPDAIELGQNYPNPFNPTTNIPVKLAKTGKVRLTVFDVLGRRVATLIDGPMRAGTHQVTFNASRLASGIYFYRLQTGDKVLVHKMLLLK